MDEMLTFWEFFKSFHLMILERERVVRGQEEKKLRINGKNSYIC